MRSTLPIALVLVLSMAGCADADGENGAGPVVVPLDTTSTTTAASSTSTPETTATTSTTAPATTTTSTPSLDDLEIEAIEFANGFEQPILLLAAPGDTRIYVVDQPGVVWMIDGDPQVFLDIRADVRFGGEQGLLGLAFDPDYDSNGRFYVHYSASDGDTIIEEFVADDGTVDPQSGSEVLRIDQPAGNHNGGMIAFGPDGNLWIGLGDGGGADDQFGHGQRSDTLLGAMLRIDPQDGTYSIPDGNLDGEVWAFGLRNPWRWSFDGDDLWIGDVGQNRIEEVNVVKWNEGNPNFGWSIMEGTECFRGDECSGRDLVLPVYEYTHSDGCSITGGDVYRGESMPELAGQFIFGDYCAGWVRSVDRLGSAREWLPSKTLTKLTSFGVDAAGEMYALTADGAIYLLRRAASN